MERSPHDPRDLDASVPRPSDPPTVPQATRPAGARPTDTAELPVVPAAVAATGVPPARYGPPPAGPPGPPGADPHAAGRPEAVGPEADAPRPRHGLTKWIVGGIVGALLLVLIGAGIVEYAARSRVSNCIENAVREQLGTEVDVSFGSRPLILAAATKELPHIGIASVTGSKSDIDLTADGLDFADANRITAERLNLTARLSTDSLLEALKSSGGALGGLIQVTGLTAQPESQQFTVEIAGGLATAQVVPTTNSGQIQIDVVKSTVLGMSIPDSLTSMISDVFQENLAKIPEGLELQQLEVTDSGVLVTLKGTDVTLNSLQDSGYVSGAGADDASAAAGCSTF